MHRFDKQWQGWTGRIAGGDLKLGSDRKWSISERRVCVCVIDLSDVSGRGRRGVLGDYVIVKYSFCKSMFAQCLLKLFMTLHVAVHLLS